jgi:NAD(P)-dependent dehydrogenase (short-subunit alcohol dehydrogenase family)
MAKAALEALARTLANENQALGIRVNIVAPGVVDTRLGHLVMDRIAGHAETPGPEVLMIDPETVARNVCFLISDASVGITGERLTISAQPRIDGITDGLSRRKEFA